VEVESLEEIKLVNIEHKNHDPYQVVNKHLIHCGMKAYEHERSIYDDMFIEVKTYEEVLNRVRALPLDLQTSFMTFRIHWQCCLPNILQDESTTPPPDQEGPPPSFEIELQDTTYGKGNMKDIEMPSQETKFPQT
jgi:hypothetical protein